MSENIRNEDAKKNQLKEIIAKLNENTDVKKVRKEFDILIRDISPEEIADIEQTMIKEGVPVEHVQKLCDVHVQVFDSALKKQPKLKVVPGHPVFTFKAENKEARKIIRRLKSDVSDLRKGRRTKFTASFAELRMIDTHYVRKENQLFPFLESVNFTGPSKVMWGKHDEIRARFNAMEKAFSDKQYLQLEKLTKEQIKAVKNMIFMEEKILFPTALRKLPDSAWVKIRRGESSIGYSWIKPGNLWDANIAGSRIEKTDELSAAPGTDEKISLDTGELSGKQINLMLKNLPFDMTFVDENGKVAYYSEGRERIFPRSPGIIGRDVANCHPPKSVHIVEKIIEQLKNKEKNAAEFWIKMNGMFINIRYFPLFDELNVFRGIIEVSQEITDIRALEGEKRLLDW